MSEHQHTPVTATRPPRGLAIAALILGISAAVTAWVPFLGAVLGITAVILGIIALKRRQPKAFGLTGLILGALATIGSIIMAITFFAFTSNVINELEGWETTDLSDTSDESTEFEMENDDEFEMFEESDSGAIPWDSMSTEDAALSTNSGTEDDPHKIGSKIVGDGFELVVNSVNIDAVDEILSLEPENTVPEDGKRYVLFHITLNNQADEPMATEDVSLYYATSSQWYPARSSKVAVPPQPELYAENQQITGNFSGYVTFVTKDVDGAFLLIEHDSFEDKQYVAVQ